jgi:uncharacterized protein YbcI
LARTPSSRDEEPQTDLTTGRMLAAVSTAMVRLYSELYGRGPTKARTEWIGDRQEMLICVLQDCFTRVERTLVGRGELDAVRHVRRAFQDAVRDEFVNIVESITGRRVVGFLSQVSGEPEVAIEFFMLEPLRPAG